MKNAVAVFAQIDRLFFRLVMLLGLAGGLYGTAQAQVSTLNVLKRTAVAVAYEEKLEEQILFIQIDHVAGDSIKSQTYPLSGNSRYRVYAIGDDDRIADIDLSVLNSSNVLVNKDADAENIAIVEFTVRYSGTYTFRVSPYKMRPGKRDGFYSLVVVRLD